MAQYRKPNANISKCQDCTSALLDHTACALCIVDTTVPGEDNTRTRVLLYIKLSALTDTHFNHRKQILDHHLSAFTYQMHVSLDCTVLESLTLKLAV